MNAPFIPIRGTRGQALVETAIVLPLLVLLVLNVINFGYFFLVIVNLSAAGRSGTLYSIEGGATPLAGGIPSSGGATPTTNQSSVTYLIYQDLTGSLANPTGVTVQVCSQANLNSSSAGTNSDQKDALLRTNCETCTSSGCSPANGGAATTYDGSPVPDADPESPSFVLNRVDIQYDVTPLFPGTIFNIPLRASGMCTSGGTCTFFRHVQMRAMN